MFHEVIITSAGYLVAYATLRLLKPSCDLEGKWTEEPLRKQLERVIEQIHSETVSSRSGDQKEAFSAPTFAYCFYLLRAVLQNGGASVGGDEDVMVKALDVLEAHTKLRSDGRQTGVDEVIGMFVSLDQFCKKLIIVTSLAPVSLKIHA